MQQLVQRGVDGELAVADGLDEARAGGRLLRHHLLLPGPLPRSHLGAQAQLVHNLLLGILPGALRSLPGSVLITQLLHTVSGTLSQQPFAYCTPDRHALQAALTASKSYPFPRTVPAVWPSFLLSNHKMHLKQCCILVQ